MSPRLTRIKEYELRCSCGNQFKTPLYDSINITVDPELLRLLYDGEFNVAECPCCHTRSYVDKWFLFHDMERNGLIRVDEGKIDGFLDWLEREGYFKKMEKEAKIRSVEVHGHRFTKICDLEPVRDSSGNIVERSPQEEYDRKEMSKLHKYGNGSFCSFRIPQVDREGVYLLRVGGEVAYVGEAENLATRFNSGYGLISPRKCYVGGQQTNCRINKLLLEQFKAGRSVELFFLETDNRLLIEAKLIKALHPPWNLGEGKTGMAPVPRTTQRVERRGKYHELGSYLEKQTVSVVTMTYELIEKIIGAQLPSSAYNYREWWSNGGHSQCDSWMSAGWRVDEVKLGRSVSFRRVG